MTFHKLMQDTRVNTMNPVQQEAEYIRLEKERIKMGNMHQQLLNFKKDSKQKPHEIKVSPLTGG